MTFKPNITGNYTIDKYKENEFVNGYVSINSSEILDKVDDYNKLLVIRYYLIPSKKSICNKQLQSIIKFT